VTARTDEVPCYFDLSLACRSRTGVPVPAVGTVLRATAVGELLLELQLTGALYVPVSDRQPPYVLYETGELISIKFRVGGAGLHQNLSS
jgi:hypothetical protein